MGVARQDYDTRRTEGTGKLNFTLLQLPFQICGIDAVWHFRSHRALSAGKFLQKTLRQKVKPKISPLGSDDGVDCDHVVPKRNKRVLEI